ncbi:Short chain fatty acids transporter [Serinicoccus hydrothermalis]|uniref:Short chain fatty acids transporter n=1 Tax=Serinicoccus hydrothermalis TaxID=1758689 RepID=A0A1B1N9I5_9MICO|nr:TIGR00366 family protein [Serinicoccus hydrothermalis]ANS78086.1 Short chain fatty acids transporter [Serinicoccus hydrothermalis]
MLSTLSRPLARFVERWLPGSFALAILLTLVVGTMALTMTDTGLADVILAWGDGLTGLLAFMTQVALVLLLGYTLANVPPVHRLLVRVASLPRGPRQAYGFVALMGGIASLISFGLGLIVAGVMAVEVARVFRDRGTKLHYPLLVASGYSGFVVWHMGYSGSGPLNAATEGGAYTDLPGGLVEVTRTTFSSWNIIAVVVTLVVVVGAMMLLAPRQHDEIVLAPDEVFGDSGSGGTKAARSPKRGNPAKGADTAAETATPVPADRIDGFRGVTVLAGVLLSAYLVIFFLRNGFVLNLDIVNWTFLALILLLVGNARELAALIRAGGSTVGEVLLQYPLYAGIIGMMSATGLSIIISEWFVQVSSAQTLGFFTFLAAGLLNMFVPSGGGQFALTAPLFATAADSLGVDQSVVIMAVAYGDQWTNMIQPFWAVPLLAVAGLRVRDILGYTLVTLVLSGIVFAATLLIVGAG